MMFYNFNMVTLQLYCEGQSQHIREVYTTRLSPCLILFPEEKKDMSSSLQQRLKIEGVDEDTTYSQCMLLKLSISFQYLKIRFYFLKNIVS